MGFYKKKQLTGREGFSMEESSSLKYARFLGEEEAWKRGWSKQKKQTV